MSFEKIRMSEMERYVKNTARIFSQARWRGVSRPTYVFAPRTQQKLEVHLPSDIALTVLWYFWGTYDEQVRNGCFESMLTHRSIEQSALGGHLEQVSALLAGAGSDDYALQYACAGGHFDTVKKLLTCGRRSITRTIVYNAILSGNVALVKYLSGQVKGFLNVTTAELATASGSLKMIEFICGMTEEGCQMGGATARAIGGHDCRYVVECGGALRWEAAVGAAVVGDIKTFRHYAHGKDTGDMWVPVCEIAAGRGHFEIFKYIWRVLCMCDNIDDISSKMLRSAITNGRSAVVDYLIGQGVKVLLEEDTVTHACRYGMDNVINAHVENDGKMEFFGNIGAAIESGKMSTIRLVLDLSTYDVDEIVQFATDLVQIQSPTRHPDTVSLISEKISELSKPTDPSDV
jgi:hypothetical protein